MAMLRGCNSSGMESPELYACLMTGVGARDLFSWEAPNIAAFEPGPGGRRG